MSLGPSTMMPARQHTNHSLSPALLEGELVRTIPRWGHHHSIRQGHFTIAPAIHLRGVRQYSKQQTAWPLTRILGQDMPTQAQQTLKELAQEGYHGRQAQRAPQSRWVPPHLFSLNCSACPLPHLRTAQHSYHRATLSHWCCLPETDRQQTKTLAMLPIDAESHAHVTTVYEMG